MMKKLILFPCGCLIILCSLCLLASIFSSSFRTELQVIRAKVSDTVYEITSGDSTCNNYFPSPNGRGLLNIADQATLNKEYDTITDAINNYPWYTQYLPEADVYCSTPWSISSIEIKGAPVQDVLDPYSYAARVVIKGIGNDYGVSPVVIVKFNPQTKKYKVTSVQWFRA
jgi:hypothetical protein